MEHPGIEFMNDGTVKVTRVSPFSGTKNTLTVRATRDQFDDWVDGNVVQRAFPLLSAEEREFIMTGITAEEWDEAFKEPEETMQRCVHCRAYVDECRCSGGREE